VVTGLYCTTFDLSQGCASRSKCAAACSSGSVCSPISADWNYSGWC
jgi:hypothetical protein